MRYRGEYRCLGSGVGGQGEGCMRCCAFRGGANQRGVVVRRGLSIATSTLHLRLTSGTVSFSKVQGARCGLLDVSSAGMRCPASRQRGDAGLRLHDSWGVREA